MTREAVFWIPKPPGLSRCGERKNNSVGVSRCGLGCLLAPGIRTPGTLLSCDN